MQVTHNFVTQMKAAMPKVPPCLEELATKIGRCRESCHTSPTILINLQSLEFIQL